MPAYYLEIIVVALGLALLLADAFLERAGKRWLGGLAMLGLAVVFGLNFLAHGGEGGFWKYYTYAPGSLAGFFKGLALASAFLVILMSGEYLPVVRQYSAEGHGAGEFLVLPVFACAGMMWAASATDLVSIFVSIELITVSFYVLVAYMRRNTGSLEAGVKYLILGALSTGFMVYGIAWIVGMTGVTNLEALARAVQTSSPQTAPGLLFGLALLLVGLGFKVGAFPFCLWIPDVYQGAPTPTAAFLSVGSKSAGFIVLWRVLESFQQLEPLSEMAALSQRVAAVLTVIGLATLLYGSLVAMLQTNFKRLLAYSSISQAGFLLLAISCVPLLKNAGPMPAPGAILCYFLGSYLMMAMLAFLVLSVVAQQVGGDDLAALQGLGRRSPFLAFGVLVSMVSLAGIPLTAGFFGKFFVFQMAIAAQAWWPLGLAGLGAACGFYYYLKVVRAMYFLEPELGRDSGITLAALPKAAILILVVGIFGFGVNPRPLLLQSNVRSAAAPVAAQATGVLPVPPP